MRSVWVMFCKYPGGKYQPEFVEPTRKAGRKMLRMLRSWARNGERYRLVKCIYVQKERS